MVKKGFTFVEITVVGAIITLLVAIAIPKLLSARVTANSKAAELNVRSMSIAAETFASEHGGVYPDGVLELRTSINSADHYCGKVVRGYKYTCDLAESGYTIVATPVTPGVSGGPTFTATTTGVLTPS